MDDNQPRYTTQRLRDEVDKAKAQARTEALEDAAAWHDAEAARYPARYTRKIALHQISAAAIRAMKKGRV
ncbi:hypothetical protein RvVAR031_36520 [Agrobacterium vitis]|uniref:hypothetical protein n=1 Tax=Agrobacterium vitis TaxID=373 RepID=UPI0015D9C816|nr:hypothetical protein [Agrobacterium vitis]BCH56042.1 hypothetical protein RvVAR031_36520 [Agrobacterium vitis]